MIHVLASVRAANLADFHPAIRYKILSLASARIAEHSFLLQFPLCFCTADTSIMSYAAQ